MNAFFVTQYLRKYIGSEVENLLVDRVEWKADARCLHSKNLRLVLWMDMDYFFQESSSPARVCHS